MIAEATKRCSKCGEVKGLGEFYVSQRKGRTEVDTICKACRKIARQIRYARMRDSGTMIVANAGDQRTCKTCGKTFLQRSRGAASNYCCKACYRARDNANRITCAHCGRVVKRPKKHKAKQHYCSPACQYEARRTYRVCPRCGERKKTDEFAKSGWCRECAKPYGAVPADSTIGEWSQVVDAVGVEWGRALCRCISGLRSRDKDRQRAADPWMARLDGIVGSLKIRARSRHVRRRKAAAGGDKCCRDWCAVAHKLARMANEKPSSKQQIFGGEWVRKFRTTTRNWQRKAHARECQ